MKNTTLRISLLALALGMSAEIPYLAIRAVRWFTPTAPSGLTLAGFWFSFARFTVVALACSLAALQPLYKSFIYWRRRQLLRELWLLLRESTPELTLQEAKPRIVDMMALGNSWERLHRRVIEIRDSMALLYNGWASPGLLQEANDYSSRIASPGEANLIAVACCIEATRREALAGSPKLYQELDDGALPLVQANASTMRQEVIQLVRLHRRLKSPVVVEFADWRQRP